jgi:DNA-binding transcriptional regulator YiaG
MRLPKQRHAGRKHGPEANNATYGGDEMANFAITFKDEVARIARKEVRKLTEALNKGSAARRRDVTELRRQIAELEKSVAVLQKQAGTTAAAEPAPEESDSKVRFTAKGLKSQRARLGLSAAEYAVLCGVTPQTIYNWETSKARPRGKQLDLVAGLRGIGKKEAKALLADAS